MALTTLISGASGLVGSAIVPALGREGHRVIRLVRRPPRNNDEIQWDPAASVALPADVHLDNVIHLAGENISGLWTAEKKRRIHSSRVVGTRTLANFLAARAQKPAAFICASAVGYYGSRGDELLTEESAPGTGFLAATCREWEQAAQPAAAAGIRTVHLRLGIVLSKKGGALAPMLLPFRFGLGATMGSGKQWFPWIALADLVRVFLLAVNDTSIRGPMNATSPEPVTNAEFTRALAQAVHRPSWMRIPEALVKLAPGGMAEEALLASTRAVPARLQALGFSFEHPGIAGALRAALNERPGNERRGNEKSGNASNKNGDGRA